MATADKTKNSAQRAKGKVRAAAGTVASHDNVPPEGKAKMKDNLKQAGYVPDETT
jgi:uncharacterized protein YjbJ (UPF0337 family)